MGQEIKKHVKAPITIKAVSGGTWAGEAPKAVDVGNAFNNLMYGGRYRTHGIIASYSSIKDGINGERDSTTNPTMFFLIFPYTEMYDVNDAINVLVTFRLWNQLDDEHTNLSDGKYGIASAYSPASIGDQYVDYSMSLTDADINDPPTSLYSQVIKVKYDSLVNGAYCGVPYEITAGYVAGLSATIIDNPGGDMLPYENSTFYFKNDPSDFGVEQALRGIKADNTSLGSLGGLVASLQPDDPAGLLSADGLTPNTSRCLFNYCHPAALYNVGASTSLIYTKLLRGSVVIKPQAIFDADDHEYKFVDLVAYMAADADTKIKVVNKSDSSNAYTFFANTSSAGYQLKNLGNFKVRCGVNNILEFYVYTSSTKAVCIKSMSVWEKTRSPYGYMDVY